MIFCFLSTFAKDGRECKQNNLEIIYHVDVAIFYNKNLSTYAGELIRKIFFYNFVGEGLSFLDVLCKGVLIGRLKTKEGGEVKKTKE